MPTIITYDVPSGHVELKQSMAQRGYVDQIPNADCGTLYFPNTCLYHATKSPQEARTDLQAVCKELAIRLERTIATKFEGWSAICGEPFKNGR